MGQEKGREKEEREEGRRGEREEGRRRGREEEGKEKRERGGEEKEGWMGQEREKEERRGGRVRIGEKSNTEEEWMNKKRAESKMTVSRRRGSLPRLRHNCKCTMSEIFQNFLVN